MESVQERTERVERLERERAERRSQDVGGTVWPTPDDAGTGVIPLEIAPGRGDLNRPIYGFLPTFPTALSLVGGKTVSFARLFQSQPRVFASVLRLMGASSRVPLKLYRRTGSENSRVRLYPEDHPLARAIVSPWHRGSQVDLITSLLGPVLVHGNAVMPTTVMGDIIEFKAEDWRFTRPLMPFRDQVDGFAFNVDNTRFRYEKQADDVLHVRWWSPIGPVGTSPLMALGITLNIEDAAQRHQRASFANGVRPPLAVTMSPDWLRLPAGARREAMQNFRGDLTRIYGGPDNAGIPALLPPGLDMTDLPSSTAVEAALVEQRKLAQDEINDVYQLPKLPDRATAQTMDMIRQMLYVDALGPPLMLIEQAINAQIIVNVLQDPDLYVEFDFGGVLRGDRLAEIQALREAIGTALMTPNEGRDTLNLPRQDDPAMDQFFMPFNNLWPINSPPIPGGKPAPADPGGTEGPGSQPGATRLYIKADGMTWVKEYVDA